MHRSLFLSAAAAASLLLAGAAPAATVVPLAPFKSIGLQGGGTIVLRHGDVQRVTLLKGSTDYTRFKLHGSSLDIEACNNDCPHNYDLQIEIVSPVIEAVAIQGGGEIKAEGAFPAASRLEAAVSGGGDIDVRAIAAASVDAAVNGGGDITYYGNPRVNQAVMGGGSVTHAAP